MVLYFKRGIGLCSGTALVRIFSGIVPDVLGNNEENQILKMKPV